VSPGTEDTEMDRHDAIPLNARCVVSIPRQSRGALDMGPLEAAVGVSHAAFPSAVQPPKHIP
jgi:hypothetical protein